MAHSDPSIIVWHSSSSNARFSCGASLARMRSITSTPRTEPTRQEHPRVLELDVQAQHSGEEEDRRDVRVDEDGLDALLDI